MKKYLKIIGGIYKNKRIQCPSGEIRPTMSIVRETLFQVFSNIFSSPSYMLSPHHACKDIQFLDLFSGSGLMALEAISRGASKVFSVENDSQKWHTIETNFSSIFSHEKDIPVILCKTSVELFLLKTQIPFEIIYCDPPFSYKHKHDLMRKISKSNTVFQNGIKKSIVVIHVHTKEKIYSTYNNLTCIKRCTVGSSSLYFYQAATP